MAELSETFRRRSKEQSESSLALFAEADFDTNAKKQAMFVIGQVNATMLDALADVLDNGTLLGKSAAASALFERRRKVLERNDAIRLAAAKGEWDEFDRLAAGRDSSGDDAAAGDGA